MIKILGTAYITDKEASLRYGYSQAWFQKQRYKKKGPHYIKLNGKILYHLDETDKWFKDQICKY